MTRKEAIERLNYLNNKCDPYECPDTECHKCDEAVDMAIEALEQEPKRGKWEQAKDIEKEYAVCTNCKHHGEFYMDYCPNCGAKMERDE